MISNWALAWNRVLYIDGVKDCVSFVILNYLQSHWYHIFRLSCRYSCLKAAVCAPPWRKITDCKYFFFMAVATIGHFGRLPYPLCNCQRFTPSVHTFLCWRKAQPDPKEAWGAKHILTITTIILRWNGISRIMHGCFFLCAALHSKVLYPNARKRQQTRNVKHSVLFPPLR